MIPAIKKGFFQSEIAEAAYRYQREIDKGERNIVGVNAFAEDKPLNVPILKMDPDGYERQVNRLNQVRKTRDNRRVWSLCGQSKPILLDTPRYCAGCEKQ